jgi:hypothetical protein
MFPSYLLLILSVLPSNFHRYRLRLEYDRLVPKETTVPMVLLMILLLLLVAVWGYFFYHLSSG